MSSKGPNQIILDFNMKHVGTGNGSNKKRINMKNKNQAITCNFETSDVAWHAF